MSDPKPDKLRPRPQRAEPLQPDNPGRGSDRQPADEAGGDDARRSSERAARREKDALDNTREGYGGSAEDVVEDPAQPGEADSVIEKAPHARSAAARR